MKGVLFLCVANSARSQMAEGIARSLGPATAGTAFAGSWSFSYGSNRHNTWSCKNAYMRLYEYMGDA